MKFGMALFGISPRHYGEAARVAEENGFESVWIPEHLVFPADMPPTYPYTESGLPAVNPGTALYDPWVVLGYLAHATESIRLGTEVYILPLRHPIATARSVLTVDRLSGGRVTVGVGVGWLEPEFEVVGQSFHDRGRRTDEIIPLLRRLWTEETVSHAGDHYSFGPVRFEPKPVQKPCPPVEVGGATPAALRRAGCLGDGWIEIGARHIDVLQQMLAVVDKHRRDAGRDKLPFEVTTTSGLARDRTSVRRCRDIGVTRIIAAPELGPGRPSLDDVTGWIKRVADDLIAGV
ncbi:MAG: TIGR03619 family F420-dependent LLM class oxidoreductase [Actinobacteria bacterium]|nr:MAG: TIGR03619 family F420-dependent LLM class oxidoreductase [Actinomycetota bacterium]